MTRTDTNKAALLVLLGSMLFFGLFLWAAATSVEAANLGATERGVVTRSVHGEMGGWLRSGPFTLVVRGGAFRGVENITLEQGPTGTSCRVAPEELEIEGTVLRFELPPSEKAAVVLFRAGTEDEWTEVSHRTFGKRGYVEIAVERFGSFRVQLR